VKGLHANGHAGLTLAIFSLLMIPFGPDSGIVTIIAIATALSYIPDLDLAYGIKHRGFTHNVFFALGVGVIFGLLFYSGGDATVALLGFLGASGGLLSHILGDIIAGQKRSGEPWKLKPLVPFSDKEIGVGWFKSGSAEMNKAFLLMGCFSFVLCAMIGS